MFENIEKVLISEDQLQAKIKEMAAVISKEYEGKNPIFVGVLKGVVMFFGDFIKRVTIPCQMDFMRISSYQGEHSHHMELKMDTSSNIEGRHVVILEDIFDTGNSLQFTCEQLLAKKPASLKICTLLDKPDRRNPQVTVKADYVGFTVPNEFVVGYGLDFNEYYRNLPFIGVLKPEAYQ